MEKLNIATTGRWLSLVCASVGMLLSMPRSASAQAALTWARVELTRNQVNLFTNGQSRRARVSDVLGVNDALSTARSARAELRFNDGSLARIGESAVFRFTPNTRNFRLSNCTVLLLIPPGQGRTTIQTPNATTGIHGSALFVRFVPETNTTIVGALTNNPDGPMMAFNQDGSVEQSLYAGELVVFQDDRVQHFSFDIHEFIDTSDLFYDLNYEGLEAVQQEIQDALDQQAPFGNSDDTIDNPDFLSASPNARVASVPPIQDFSRSPAADFLQQDGIEFSSIANPPSGPVEPPPPAAPPPETPKPPTPPAPQPPAPPVKPPLGGLDPQPPQPVTPGPGAGGPAPEPGQPIEKPPVPIIQPDIVEPPPQTPEVVVAPETPAVQPVNQPINKPTELPNVTVVPDLPPETVITPIETVAEPETEIQVDRLPDSVVVQGAQPPSETAPTDGVEPPGDAPPPGQVGATPGQGGER